MDEKKSNKKIILKDGDQKQELDSSVYFETFLKAWKERFPAPADAEAAQEPEEKPIAVQEESPVAVQTEQPAETTKEVAKPALSKRMAFVALTAVFAILAMVLTIVSYVKAFPQYTAFSSMSFENILNLFRADTSGYGTADMIVNYALPSVLCVSVLLIYITVILSVAALWARKKIAPVWPAVLSFVFALAFAALLFVYKGSDVDNLTVFLNPAKGDLLYGYYIYTGCVLLAFIFSCFVNKRRKA